MNMHKVFLRGLTGCLLTCASVVCAQHPSMVPPFDFPLLFSGNFGEIRANHFHGGLDFKTGGVTGKSVRALADGYISRIRVNHGSGYVLDVVYDNGYTAINRHLSAFVGEIAKRVEDLQYEQENWEIEIVPSPEEYPVKAGQVIALSGNTGYSFGPHLHMDLIETATDENVDPLPFFISRVKDQMAPRALGLMLFPQRGRGVVNGVQCKQQFSLSPDKSITAWGVIGSGIRAYDYMDGVSNRYGVHTVILEVDGREVFRSVVDRFAYDEHRYINSWTDGQYMKSFIEPGNHLRMLHAADSRRGLVTIDEERPYQFVYTLIDAMGNTSKVRFTVQGKQTDIPKMEHRPDHVLHWDRVNYFQKPGLDLLIPRGLLYDDVYLNFNLQADSGAVSFTYQLNDQKVPLHHYVDLFIALHRFPVADSTKYYVASIGRHGKKSSVGGIMKNGRIQARIRELGTFAVAIDTVPPVLTPVNPKLWSRNRRIVFKARDKETGVRSYRGTVDGAYVLFGKPNAVSGDLVCELDAARLQKGKRHWLVMTVTDECGNETIGRYSFYY